MHIVIYS